MFWKYKKINMHTREELKAKALHYIETTYGTLIEDICAHMEQAAEKGRECVYKYSTVDEDSARAMDRYFRAKGFNAESSWSHFNKETGEYSGWYVSIFWW